VTVGEAHYVKATHISKIRKKIMDGVGERKGERDSKGIELLNRNVKETE